MLSHCKITNLNIMGDERGLLVALEENHNIPFTIKRVFYIYGTIKSVTRGNHAHYNTKQCLIAIHGSCKVTLTDGNNKQTFELNKPNKILFQDSLIWGEMHDFTPDCVLLVLANEYYKKEDYILDYDKFLKVTNR